MKTLDIKCNDIYNFTTKEYFSNIIDYAYIHSELFPVSYHTLYNGQHKFQNVPLLDRQIKDMYELDLQLGWYTDYLFKFKECAKQGHILLFKLNYKNYHTEQFGRLVDIKPDILLRTPDFPVPEVKLKRKRFDGFKQVKVINLRIESLSILEVCEILDKIK